MKVVIDLPDTTIAAFVSYVYRDNFGFGHDEGMNVKGFTKYELRDMRVDESVKAKTLVEGGENE